MKVAYFSPLPPQRTGIADYSKELLGELAKSAQIDLWVDHAMEEDEDLGCSVYNYVQTPELRSELPAYDSIIYPMGNSLAHQNLFRMMLETSGVVVMHDFVLHHFFAAHYLESLRLPDSYIAEMAYNYGAATAELARRALATERPLWENDASGHPLNKRVLDHALGVIVHSDFALRLVHASHPHLRATKIDLPVRVPRTQSDGKELKRRYGIPTEHIVIGSLGFASPAKRVHTILRAVSALNRRDLVYVMVGNVGDGVQQVLRNYGLSELVRITGHVDRTTFLDYCNLIDIGIDIRYPTMGETSASVCRILGAGKPCIVSDLGWFSEIPSDCVVKLDPTADECVLAQRLRDLMARNVLRQEIGDNARRYVLEFHNPKKAADKYLRFLDEVREAQRGSSVERTIIRDTSRSMADIGVTDRDAWFIDDVARHLATLLNAR